MRKFPLPNFTQAYRNGTGFAKLQNSVVKSPLDCVSL